MRPPPSDLIFSTAIAIVAVPELWSAASTQTVQAQSAPTAVAGGQIVRQSVAVVGKVTIERRAK